MEFQTEIKSDAVVEGNPQDDELRVVSRVSTKSQAVQGRFSSTRTTANNHRAAGISQRRVGRKIPEESLVVRRCGAVECDRFLHRFDLKAGVVCDLPDPCRPR